MKITICASLDFTNEINSYAHQLRKQGHEVFLPETAEHILEGRISLKQIKSEKESGEIVKRAIQHSVIKKHFEKIKEAAAIFVINLEKKGIKNYVGGNVFLEMGFAHVLNKKLFLLHDIPDMPYKSEIRTFQPVILHGDITKIK